MDELIEIDGGIFYAINAARSRFFDWFFAGISSHWFFALVVVAFVTYISVVKLKSHFWILLLLVALAFLFADRLSVVCFKDTFERLRPSHSLVHVFNVRFSDFDLQYANKGGQYGFVSSHAANLFCLATIFAKTASKNAIFCIFLSLWALLTMYSRIYCGYHYLTDVGCGALFGIMVGRILYRIYEEVCLRGLIRT